MHAYNLKIKKIHKLSDFCEEQSQEMFEHRKEYYSVKEVTVDNLMCSIVITGDINKEMKF